MGLTETEKSPAVLQQPRHWDRLPARAAYLYTHNIPCPGKLRPPIKASPGWANERGTLPSSELSSFSLLALPGDEFAPSDPHLSLSLAQQASFAPKVM